MTTSYRPVLKAAFDHLVQCVSNPITGNSTAGSAVITNVTPASALEMLAEGLPVFGVGVEKGAVIESIDVEAATVTLTLPITETVPLSVFTTGFLTTGRRVQHWSQVAGQPALFFRRTGVSDDVDHRSGYAVTTLECEAWIYCNALQNPDIAPDDALTALEAMVRASFAPDGDYGDTLFTLGGAAYWCRIEGRSDISPGDQDGQAIARIPIRITLP